MDYQFRKYTREQLIVAIASSTSIRQALSKLSVKEAGGNYQVIKKYIKLLNLDITHFKGHASNKGKKLGPRRNIQEYLSNSFPISSDALRRRLLKEKILLPICSNCKLTHWLDAPIPLELDHINGNHLDNSLDNLRLLCPNCHALTDNYRGKNMLKK